MSSSSTLSVLPVPSLYVRVYRAWIMPWEPKKRSLTIREGISSLLDLSWNSAMFPHYTWGYIATSGLLVVLIMVPSLYVRVYRVPHFIFFPSGSSLTIREGISASLQKIKGAKTVPSLYVRVYRFLFSSCIAFSCSLTIREGISPVFWLFGTFWKFPHYTWGYIAEDTGRMPPLCVPSLYVRVYRGMYRCTLFQNSSLTIREGISTTYMTYILNH